MDPSQSRLIIHAPRASEKLNATGHEVKSPVLVDVKAESKQNRASDQKSQLNEVPIEFLPACLASKRARDTVIAQQARASLGLTKQAEALRLRDRQMLHVASAPTLKTNVSRGQNSPGLLSNVGQLTLHSMNAPQAVQMDAHKHPSRGGAVIPPRPHRFAHDQRAIQVEKSRTRRGIDATAGTRPAGFTSHHGNADIRVIML